jgi:hypothetical protein
VKAGTSQALHTANTFLNVEFPILMEINIENLMKVRQEGGEAFANFRFALDQKLAALREIDDVDAAKRMASDAVRDLTESQLHDVHLKVASLKEKIGLSVIGGVIGLAAAVQNQGWGLLSAAAAAMPAASAYLDYRLALQTVYKRTQFLKGFRDELKVHSDAGSNHDWQYRPSFNEDCHKTVRQ